MMLLSLACPREMLSSVHRKRSTTINNLSGHGRNGSALYKFYHFQLYDTLICFIYSNTLPRYSYFENVACYIVNPEHIRIYYPGRLLKAPNLS